MLHRFVFARSLALLSLDNYTADRHGLGVDDVLIVRWEPQKQTWVAASKFGGLPL